MKTALCFRHHSGWAIVVAVSAGASPTVLHRERVELCPPTLPRQVYHDVGERALSLTAAAARIEKVEAAVTAAALAVVRHAADTFVARSVGRVAEPRELPELPAILASHPLWHAAEGELYRNALAVAASELGLSSIDVPPKTVRAEAARALSLAESDVDAMLAAIGKELGPPWQKDYKDATLAALIALSAT